MYFVSPPYSYGFSYNDDGTLKKIAAPNFSSDWKYENNRVTQIIRNFAGAPEILTFEYPSENLIRWTSSVHANDVNREFNVYHHGDVVDSSKVIDPANPATQQIYAEYGSKVTYCGDNVCGIVSGGGCCTYNDGNIEYDNGLNPLTLLGKSTGVFNGQGIIDYTFLFFKPEALSLNNPIRYVEQYTDHSGMGTSSHEAHWEFEYTYSQQGSYPITISEKVDGATSGIPFHFVYENCN